MMIIRRSELILGGQKSGKSRRAETLACQWLDASADHHAVLIATAQPWDEEMRERIARHQLDRAERVPGMATVEEPLALADAIVQHSRPNTLVVVDCLTLWLTNQRMPMEVDDADCPGGWVAGRFAPWSCLSQRLRLFNPSKPALAGSEPRISAPPATQAPPLPAQNAQPPSLLVPVENRQIAVLLAAIDAASGPLVLVGNEIGLGVIPMGAEVRAFVDALGKLNQDVAALCERVTLMAAGLPLILKESP